MGRRCEERYTTSRKESEGDGNESTSEEEERKALREDGWIE